MIAVADLLDVWAATLWRASWQGSLMALAVWFVCWFVPSMPARFQCWLWRLALLKFVIALFWSAPIEVPLLPAATLPAATLAAWESSDPVPSGLQSAESVSLAPQQASTLVTPWWILFLAWIVVVGWQTVRLLTACRNANRLRNGCRLSANKNVIDQLARLSKSLGLAPPPTLLEADGQGSPLLLGIVRPAIVLPNITLDRLDASERSLVIGHELAHVRRCDLLWSLIATFVRALFFWHPLAWLCERRLSLTQEIAADELSMTLNQSDPVGYATLLVSVVSKLGPARPTPAMAVAMAGSHQSLKQRFFAMRFMKPMSRRTVVAYGAVLGFVAVLGVVPWAIVAAEPPATDKPLSADKPRAADSAAPKAEVKKAEPTPDKVADKKVAQKDRREWGRFVSLKDGTLTFQTNSGALIENHIPASAKATEWSNKTDKYEPVDTAAALKEIKPGTPVIVQVSNDNFAIRIGARKGRTIGTFVSYKDNRLLILGKNLGESFTKKYGNSVHFHRFRDDVPVYESIDGGEYKLVGTPGTVLSNVKEGTIITVHGEGDDNITLVQIGVPRQP